MRRILPLLWGLAVVVPSMAQRTYSVNGVADPRTGAYAFTHPGYMRQQWDALMEQFTHAAIRPVAPEVVSLEEISTKLREMEDRTLSGKIVAVMAPRP